MIADKATYKTKLFNVLCVTIIGALMFFIAQGNSMFVTDLFADKVVELVDSQTPAPAEERSDSGKTNPLSEEYHLESTVSFFVQDYFAEINFHFENSSLHSVLKQRVLTPPPEFS